MSRSRQKKIRRFPLHPSQQPVANSDNESPEEDGQYLLGREGGGGKEGRNNNSNDGFCPSATTTASNGPFSSPPPPRPPAQKRRRRGRGRREEEIALTASFFAAPKITLLPAMSLLPSASVEMGVLPLFCVSARTHAPRTWYGRKGSNVPFFRMGKGHSPRPFSFDGGD